MSQAGPETMKPDNWRAYRLGIVNGILFAIGMAFVDPTTVLPTFVSRLTDSEVLIGLVSTIGLSGWFLPQLLSASYIQSRPYKRPFYIFAAFLRGFGLLALVPIIILFAASRPTVALAAFFASYILYSYSGGMSGPAFLDIVAKTVPGARLGRFFGNRQFWGGLGAIAAARLVKFILETDDVPFPSSYALLFGLALAVFAPGWFAFAMVREPAGRVEPRQGLLAFLQSAPEAVLHHSEYRLLLISRLLTGGAGIALPFYIIYCRKVLEMPEAAAGTYLSVAMTGSVLLIPLWAYLNDRRGPRALLIALAALYLTIPGIALIASCFPAALPFGRLAFGAVFFPMAAVGGGSFMGYTNYLFAIAPEERRPLYIGTINTLFAATGFLPLLGGFIVHHASFQALFAVAATLGMLGFFATVRLPSASSSAAD
jgi:MFS family permease